MKISIINHGFTTYPASRVNRFIGIPVLNMVHRKRNALIESFLGAGMLLTGKSHPKGSLMSVSGSCKDNGIPDHGVLNASRV